MRQDEIGLRSQDRLIEPIDVGAVREAFDSFGAATGLPIQILDGQGLPLSGTAEILPFCGLIRSSSKGFDLCRKKAIANCPRTVGATAGFTAHFGLMHHIVAPILAQGGLAGVVLVGPFGKGACHIEAVRQRAKFLNLSEELLLTAARDIPYLSDEKVAQAAKLLSSLSWLASEHVSLKVAARELQLVRRRDLEESLMLRRVVEIVNAGLDPRRALTSILEFALHVTTSNAAVIRLRQGDDLVWKTSVGFKSEDIKLERVPVGQGLTGRAAAEAKVISSVDVQRSEEAGVSKLLATERFHGFLSVPLKTRGGIVGVLTTYRRKRRRYLDDDVRRLALLADQIALVIDNSLLYEEGIRAEKRAMLLAEAGKIFSSSLDIDEVLDMVTQRIGEALDSLCTIVLPDEGGVRLELKAVFHRNPAKIDLLQKMIEATPLRPGIGLAGRAYQTGEPLFIDGGGPDTFPNPDRPYHRAVNMTSAIAVPLRAKGRVLGAMVVAITDSNRRFDQNDVGLVHSLAARASVSIENAQLYQRVQAERNRLQAVISGMADGVVMVDKDGKVVAINRAGQEIFGKGWETTRPDRAGSGLAGPLLEDGGSHVVDTLPLRRVLSEGLSVLNAEIEFRRGDGELRICQLSAAPVEDYAGAIVGAVAVFRDVTTLKEVERLKDEIISVVSHELRGPLTAISGYTQMLIRQLSKREGMDGEIDELKLMLMHTQRLTTMVRDFLDIPRLELGQLPLNKRHIPLPTLVRGVVNRSKVLSNVHEIEVRVPEELPPIYADQERVEQIVGNLISNAIKYSPKGGQVLVSVTRRGDMAVVSVQDWGIGIERKYLSRLFERFSRVDNRESREFEGIGLGLHVAKLLIEAHHGRIWARSRKDQGTTVSFSLPLSGGNLGKNSYS